MYKDQDIKRNFLATNRKQEFLQHNYVETKAKSARLLRRLRMAVNSFAIFFLNLLKNS